MNQHPQVSWVLWEVTPQGIHVRCSVCGVEGVAPNPKSADAFAAQHAEHRSQAQGYYGAGDVVAAATKRLGIESCTPCEARRRAMNGWLPKVWRR